MIIYHISDLHIRPNSRVNEYEYVFDEFVKTVKADPSEKCVVITGDIFHDKTRIDSPGIYLFNKLLNDLNPIDTYIIRGNHDYKQWKKDEIDMISSILMSNVHQPHIHYLDKTCTYTFGNLCFGVLAIQDVLLDGHTSSIEKKSETFLIPEPRQSCQYKILLFHGKPIFNFDNYDFVMLGDIHQRSVWKHKHTLLGYAGSMIRQNKGESENSHGYLRWDLGNKQITEHDIFNPFNQITKDQGIDIKDISFSIKDCSKVCDDSLLLVKDYDESVSKKIHERNHKIKKKIEEFRDIVGKFSAKTDVRLLNMKWNWILCYGPNNEFDFTSLDNKVNCINASNATGKSSLLETIVISLFGTGFPTRTRKDFSASIINTNKPPGSKCNTVIIIILNGKMFRITRSFSLQDSEKFTLHTISRSTFVEVFVENEGWSSLKTGKSATDDWVFENIGPIKNIMMTHILSQDGDFNFFNMCPLDQKNAIDEIFCINAYNLLYDIFKESKLAHHYINDLISFNTGAMNKQVLQKELEELLKNNTKKNVEWVPTRLEPKQYYQEKVASYDITVFENLAPYNDRINPCEFSESIVEEYKSFRPNSLPNIFCDRFDFDRYTELSKIFANIENPITDTGGPFNPRCKCCQQRKKSVVDLEMYIEWIKLSNYRRLSISNAIRKNMGNIEDIKYIHDNYDAIEIHMKINCIKNKLLNYSCCFEEEWIDDIRSRLKKIDGEMEQIQTQMKDIYENQILPYICTQVNSILKTFTIDFKINSKGLIDWFVKHDNRTVFLNKISGFQKFALNLAIRIVFSKIGNLKLKQIFIDEGFSCCDEENLSEIPDFLNKLLSIYTSITIVSHLNELKDYFPNKITIKKGGEGFSILVKN